MSAQFEARFSSPCALCDTTMREGETVTWLDDEVVHIACAADPDLSRANVAEPCARCFMVPATNGACGCDQ